uniref:Uncharacterized protein n=1 Tax=Hyaloperonospora arabidopsidis (strain Emoy2) TaxID=559515 RepID=M4B205_HYAAE
MACNLKNAHHRTSSSSGIVHGGPRCTGIPRCTANHLRSVTVPPLHDNLHKVIVKYEYYAGTNTVFSQYYSNR